MRITIEDAVAAAVIIVLLLYLAGIIKPVYAEIPRINIEYLVSARQVDDKLTVTASVSGPARLVGQEVRAGNRVVATNNSTVSFTVGERLAYIVDRLLVEVGGARYVVLAKTGVSVSETKPEINITYANGSIIIRVFYPANYTVSYVVANRRASICGVVAQETTRARGLFSATVPVGRGEYVVSVTVTTFLGGKYVLQREVVAP